jgi:hypothetical protein
MSPEFIAILVTSVFQGTLLITAIGMNYRLGQMLERMDMMLEETYGISSATFLDGRKERAEIKASIDEVQRMVREELLKKS